MRYALTHMTKEIVMLWLAVMAIAGLICFFLCRRGRLKGLLGVEITLLAGYLFFLLVVTLFDREPVGYRQYKGELFWSYRAALAGNRMLRAEVLWNVLLFVPIGYLFSDLLPRRKKWLACLIGAILTFAVEETQLLTHLGMFDYDDMISNAAGTAIGYCGYHLLRLVPWRGMRICLFVLLCGLAAFMINGINA